MRRLTYPVADRAAALTVCILLGALTGLSHVRDLKRRLT